MPDASETLLRAQCEQPLNNPTHRHQRLQTCPQRVWAATGCPSVPLHNGGQQARAVAGLLPHLLLQHRLLGQQVGWPQVKQLPTPPLHCCHNHSLLVLLLPVRPVPLHQVADPLLQYGWLRAQQSHGCRLLAQQVPQQLLAAPAAACLAAGSKQGRQHRNGWLEAAGFGCCWHLLKTPCCLCCCQPQPCQLPKQQCSPLVCRPAEQQRAAVQQRCRLRPWHTQAQQLLGDCCAMLKHTPLWLGAQRRHPSAELRSVGNARQRRQRAQLRRQLVPHRQQLAGAAVAIVAWYPLGAAIICTTCCGCWACCQPHSLLLPCRQRREAVLPRRSLQRAWSATSCP